MTYEIIQSGSKGNATIADGKILIDCGVPFYLIEPHLMNLKLVLLTHKHSDHFKKGTVSRMARARPGLKWACREWMVEPLIKQGVDKRNIHALDSDIWVEYAEPLNIKVCPFDTRHDTPNCGWKIWRKRGDSLFYATDLADLDGIEAKGYQTYLLEANYREEELQRRIDEKMDAGIFAYETRTAETHMSWEQAMAWLAENMEPDSVWIPMHQHREKESENEQWGTDS